MMPRDVWAISDALIANDLEPDEEAIAQCELAKASLDYSVESVARLESYLEVIRRQGWDQLREDDKFTATIFRAGAYVGEVVLRAQPGKWRWADDDELAKNNRLAHYIGQPNIETALTLISASGTWTWPVSRVVKYLAEGPDESVSQYAYWLLNMQIETASC